MTATNIRQQHSAPRQAVRPLRSDLRRRREFCYVEGCRAFFGTYRTVIIDEARNGKVVCVEARCHGAIFAGSDVLWYFHLATGGAL